MRVLKRSCKIVPFLCHCYSKLRNFVEGTGFFLQIQLFLIYPAYTLSDLNLNCVLVNLWCVSPPEPKYWLIKLSVFSTCTFHKSIISNLHFSQRAGRVNSIIAARLLKEIKIFSSKVGQNHFPHTFPL